MSLKPLLVRAARTVLANVLPATTRHDGWLLPGKQLRLCGPEFWDEALFLSSGRTEAARLVQHFELGCHTRLLDVGCGVGRLAIGLMAEVGELEAYCGVDVSQRSVNWCSRHLTPAHPGFRFVHVDVKNERYNPAGAALHERFRFPFEDGSFDLINLFSVFSHMVTEDVASYLTEFHRLLSPDGGIFLTAFIEDDVPDMEENPPGYRDTEWSGALHCVRFNRAFFYELLARHGFEVISEENVGQTGLYLRRVELPHPTETGGQ